jgi:hypothetical protein
MKSTPLLFLLLCASVFAEDIKTSDGQVLKDATITKNDAIGVTISHSDGITRVPYANLPEELRKKFNYDPNQAQAQATAERAAAMQRAQAAQAFERQQAAAAADAAAGKALDQAAIAIVGKVLSVTQNGVLLTDATIGIPVMKNVVTERNPFDGSPRAYAKQAGIDTVSSKEPIFIYGVAALVDGDQYSGKVYPAPNYAYTSAVGAAKTVRAFAATKEMAKQLLTK